MIDSRQMLDSRGRLLLISLDFVGLRQEAGCSAVEIQSLRRWLDSWPGVGAIERGMAHQGYDLQLTRYDEQGWRATFHPGGMEHSATSAVGRVGADAMARGAACSVGGAQGERQCLLSPR